VANQRDIKNRIKSITNTKKITSTMEMVSTAKMKKLQTRLEQSKPYEKKVSHIINNLLSSGDFAQDNPVIKGSGSSSKVIIFQITGNRGLCGSFNTNIIETTMKNKKKLEAEGKEVLLYIIGKKGTGFYNFNNIEMYKSEKNLEDKVTFEDVVKISKELNDLYLSGEVNEVYVSYSKVLTNTKQEPEILRLLPISEPEKNVQEPKEESKFDYIFEPSEEKILSYLLPLYLKAKLFSCFLESSFSEQFARRVAMKNATDASKEMVRELTITYNRVRQAKITNEIAEIVGGAAALE